MNTANKLIEILTLEKIDENLYRGHQMQEAGKRVFGGQVLAQAIEAATDTVDTDRHMHSCHAYFILPGDTSLPIIYSVDITRDGGSFSTRRVKAIQNGADIFVLAASFQLTQAGLDHQIEMPKVPMPEGLASDYEIAKKFSSLIPEYMHRMLIEKPIEFKPVEIPDFLIPMKSEPRQNIRMRYKGDLPDDPRVHKKILAYASDYNLLITALRPHEVTLEEVQLASLDHAMWFHRDFRIDEWLLYALESPSSSNARGFTRGNIFDMSGNLVASVVQEGLLRKKKNKK